MKVHILQIPAEGKHYEGEDPASILDLHEEHVRPIEPVHYSLDVGMSDGGLFATGTVGTALQLRCVKCLEDFRFPIEVSDFACQVELPRTETVDLTEPIREDILLALPAHPHCDWNGERTCPGAFRSAEAEHSAAEPLTEARNLWGALDQLKIKP